MDNNQQYMCKESPNMSNKHSDTNSKLPKWLHRIYNTVTNVNLPRPLWLAYMVGKLGDNQQHLRQKCDQSDKPYKSGKPSQPDKCGIFTCGSDDQYCYCLANVRCSNCFDTGYDINGLQCECSDTKPNHLGWRKCPSDGKLCSTDTCPETCREQSNKN